MRTWHTESRVCWARTVTGRAPGLRQGQDPFLFAIPAGHLSTNGGTRRGQSWPEVTLAEDMAALAYLASRPDVDPARLGCGGLSGGGMRTVFIAGTADRIRCAFIAGFMTTWADFCRNVCYMHTWMVSAPGLPTLLDCPEILGLRAPLPSLVLSTMEDPLFTRTETERASRILSEVYTKAGAPDAFRISMHPGPHKFDLAMQREAFAWFERWLR